jgi:hypothetical protein
MTLLIGINTAENYHCPKKEICHPEIKVSFDDKSNYLKLIDK